MLRRQLLSVITLCNLAGFASSAHGMKNEVLARSSAAVGAAPAIDDGSEEPLAQAADEAKTNLNVENHTSPVTSVAALQDAAPQRSRRRTGGTIESDIAVASGSLSLSGESWASEVAWSLDCDDGLAHSGGAPYATSAPLSFGVGATCTLQMTDLYGDGWGAVTWEAPGIWQGPFSIPFGSAASASFVVILPPPPPPYPPGVASIGTVGELQTALADASVDRIVLAAGTYEFDSSTACNSRSWLCVDRAVTIEAARAGTVVLDAKWERRVFHITGAGVQLDGLTITRGYAPYRFQGGGGLLIDGSATLNSCQIYNNMQGGDEGGAGLFIAGNATLNSCQIYRNEAEGGGGNGGGLLISGGDATLNSCQIFGNEAEYNGGGLSIEDGGSANLNSCQIYQNDASDGDGGGLFTRRGGRATLAYCEISRNDAWRRGDGLASSYSFAPYGFAVLTCCTVEDALWGNYEEHDCPSPPPPAPPSMPPPVQTGGDPITTFQGRETRYYLSTQRFTPVLVQGPIVVSQLAGPAHPPPGLDAHKGAWVVAMEVDVAAMDKVLIETVDPTTLLVHPNATAPPATTDALTTMRLSVGGKQLVAGEHTLSIANAAAAVSAKRVGSKRRIGSGWVEQITITADGLKLRITSAKANKFADEQRQVLGLHLDVEFLAFDQSAVRGALPEMWGLQPMTENTKELLDQASADN